MDEEPEATGSTPVTLEPHYSVDQLAAEWGVSRKSIERYVASGALRSRRIGGLRRIPASAVREFQERGEAQGTIAHGEVLP